MCQKYMEFLNRHINIFLNFKIIHLYNLFIIVRKFIYYKYNVIIMLII